MAKILIIDNKVSDRLILNRTLAVDGYEIQMAGDGLQAISLVEWQRPDLILIDLDMPGFNNTLGVQTISAGHTIPIIFMLNHGQNFILPKTLDSFPLLTKPFDAIKVRSTVALTLFSRILKGKNARSCHG